MKKLYTAITVLALTLAVGVTAMAQCNMGQKGSPRGGCSSCNKAGATPEQIRKFKADSIDLRQAMMNKRFDLQRENLKETPDSAKIAAIKTEMEALKVKIDALKTAANLPVSAGCCQEDCPLMDGNCDQCQSAKGCQCKECQCKECRNGKACAKAAKDCSKCNKSTDCGCAKGAKDCSCGPDCSCAACAKGKKSAGKPAAGCKNCNKSMGSQQ